MEELEKRDLGTSEGFTVYSKSLILCVGLTQQAFGAAVRGGERRKC